MFLLDKLSAWWTIAVAVLVQAWIDRAAEIQKETSKIASVFGFDTVLILF
jgi:hypothetical protein